MCIIVYKPKGVSFPEMETLRECFFNNQDGAGFMYRLPDGQIRIDKGFMDYPELVVGLSEIPFDLNDLDLAIHFRMATHGKVNMANTHPFPVSNNPKDLKATGFVAHAALVHNGVIGFCTDKKNVKDPLSDTMVFTKDILSAIPAKQYRTKAIRKLIEKATGSKFVIMTRDDSIMIGDFIEDKGIFYSNSSYKASRAVLARANYIGSRYDYLWNGKDYGSQATDAKWDDVPGWEPWESGDAQGNYIDVDLECDGVCEDCIHFHCCDEQEREHLKDNRKVLGAVEMDRAPVPHGGGVSIPKGGFKQIGTKGGKKGKNSRGGRGWL
jgi:hypothetical protein